MCVCATPGLNGVTAVRNVCVAPLGMRRLGKQAVFLEYKDEDHGLRRKPNQEDYHKRIMAWWDHHLKGVEPAEWIVGPTKVEPLGDTAPAIPAVNGN